MQICAEKPCATNDVVDLLTTAGRIVHPRMRLKFAAHQGLNLVEANPAAPRYALCHIRNGSAVLHMAGAVLPLAAPAVLLLDESMRPEIGHARGLQMVTLYFHPSLINNAFALNLISSEHGRDSFRGSTHQDLFLLERFFATNASERVAQLPQHVHDRVRASIDLAVAESRSQPDKYWPCRVRSFLIEALFQLRMLTPVPLTSVSLANLLPAADDARCNRVARAMSFLQERYQSDFTLSEVARACCTNRTTLNAEFRAATGMTIRAYTISMRMKMAAGMLRDTVLPVAEIMNRVGYENPSHFTRAFRDTIGTSPREYRNTQC